MKKAIIVCSRLSLSPFSGANLRLITISRLLSNRGYDVTEITNRELRNLELEQSFYDLGVIVSFANLYAIQLLKRNCKKIWLDSTDSILHTRLLGLGKNKLGSYIKGPVEVFLAFVAKRNIDVITYISSLDQSWDRFLFPGINSYVIPNAPLRSQDKSPSSYRREIFFVGDTSYNANRKAIKFILRNGNQIITAKGIDLFIVTGSQFHDKKIVEFDNGTKIHFVHSLSISRLYHPEAIHIVPIWNGVGIKNKVTEPASLGVTVLAGDKSFNGLHVYSHMIPIKRKSDFFPKLNQLLSTGSIETCHDFDVILKDETNQFFRYLEKIEER
jgi:hypothetical protein